MELVIGRKVYTLHFGIEFIRVMDKRYGLEQGGVNFGVGVGLVLPQLAMGSPVALFDCIQAATCTEKSQPSRAEIEAFLSDESVDWEGLKNDFLQAFNASPLLTRTLKAAETFLVSAQPKSEGAQPDEANGQSKETKTKKKSTKAPATPIEG